MLCFLSLLVLHFGTESENIFFTRVYSDSWKSVERENELILHHNF